MTDKLTKNQQKELERRAKIAGIPPEMLLDAMLETEKIRNRGKKGGDE